MISSLIGGIILTEKEKEQQHVKKRSRYQQKKMNDNFNRLLNYLIGIVVILIAIALFVIFSMEPEKIAPTEEEAEEATPMEEDGRADEEAPAVSEDEENVEDTVSEETTDEEQEPSLADEDVEVEQVDDAGVSERWTSESWAPYPTKQEGPHASVYQKGHIDYEEKLSAIYSVIPLEQSNSILLRIQNNGSPQTSRAVVTNMDKTEIYRVFIEWVDGAGWKPTMVEVLSSLDSIE